MQRILSKINGILPTDTDKSIEQQIAEILSKNAQITNENRQLLQQLDQLNNIVDEIETERTRNDLIEADIVTFERKLSEISQTITKPPPTTNRAAVSSTGIINELNQNLDKQLDENNSLRAKIYELQENNATLTDQINANENEKIAAAQFAQKLTKEIQQLKDKITLSENENVAATQLAEKLTTQIQQLKSTTTLNANENRASVVKQEQKLMEEIQQLKDEIVHKENENVAAAQCTMKLTDEIQQLTDDNNKLNDKINELMQGNETLNDHTKELMEKSFDDIKNTIELDQLIEENSNLKCKINDLTKEYENLIAQLKDEQISPPSAIIQNIPEISIINENVDTIGKRIDQIEDLLEKGIEKMDKAYNLEQNLVKTQIDNEIMKNTSKDNIKSIQNDNGDDSSLDWLCKRIVNSGIEVLSLFFFIERDNKFLNFLLDF